MVKINQRALFLFMVLSLWGCAATELKESPLKDNQRLFMEAQKAFDAKAYLEAIELFQEYTQKFPESESFTWALQRLGECFEGLLKVEYRLRIENGEAEPIVKRSFLAKFSHFDCWKETNDGLTYTLVHYQRILTEYPDSSIADEAAYRMIPWVKDYKSLPDGPLKELKHLQEVLAKYPTTSLRPIILYQIAHRCHILYEIYAFSPHTDIQDNGKAKQYKEKALLSYQLCLGSPQHTKYSEKSWQDLERLQKGERIYIFD